MKPSSGSAVRLDITRQKHQWHRFDVKITAPDVVIERQFGRDVLRILIQNLRKTGILRLGNVELKMERTQVARAVEMAEAVMREELC